MGMTKDEYKKKRREERKKEQEERDRKDKEPPRQYQLVKIKTSVGHYPVISYLSPFTAEEIQTGKRCLLNDWRKPPDQGVQPYSPTQHKDRQGGLFSLNV